MNKNTGRRSFIRNSSLTALSAIALPGIVHGRYSLDRDGALGTFDTDLSKVVAEWRNRQPEMVYRQLGRTGLMVSEFVMGAGIGPNNFAWAQEAIDRGLNYFDTASRYGNGNSEKGVGALVNTNSNRDKVFIATKLSSYLPTLDRLARDVFKGLTVAKQETLRKKAVQRVEQLGVSKPGYYFTYFPNQHDEFVDGYLTQVIREEYGYQSFWKNEIQKVLFETVEQSLVRMGIDTIDILHCPHGARLPEELEDETIRETLHELKRQGKIRFAGISIHTDVPRVLNKAIDVGYYDMAMVAYNIANQASMETVMHRAHQSGMGLVAMKVASAVNTPHESLKPIPQWRIDKLNAAIPGDIKIPVKAYLWALQNPSVTAVISAFKDEQMIRENLEVVGKKVDFGRL